MNTTVNDYLQFDISYVCTDIPLYNSSNHNSDDDYEIDILTAPPKLKKPPLYAVVLLNDDFTPMDFVIEILQELFSLPLDQAEQIMLTIHHKGKGIAGIYPRDIAETKSNLVIQSARSSGHPLMSQIEPQE